MTEDGMPPIEQAVQEPTTPEAADAVQELPSSEELTRQALSSLKDAEKIGTDNVSVASILWAKANTYSTLAMLSWMREQSPHDDSRPTAGEMNRGQFEPDHPS